MKRFLATTLAMLMVVCSIPNISIQAAGDDYSRIMKYDTGGVFASVQPSSAISLQSSGINTIETKDLSSNYGTKTPENAPVPIGGKPTYIDGYGIDLPMLQAPYYYELSNDTPKKFTVSDTVYPTLLWKENVSMDDVVKLSVKSYGASVSGLPTYTIRFAEAFTTSDKYHDISQNIVHEMLDAGGADCYQMSSGSYDNGLHRYALISTASDGKTYAYVPKGFAVNVTITPGLDLNNKIKTVDFVEYDGYYRSGSVITSNAWDYAKMRGVSGTMPVLMAFYNPTDYASIDYGKKEVSCNPGSIPAKIEGDWLGAFAVVLGDRLVLGKVKNAELLTKPSIADISSSAKKIEISTEDDTQSYISAFGRDDFNEFALAAENNYNFHTEESAMNFKYTGTKNQEINLFADSFAFNGYTDHVATLSLKSETGYSFTVNYQDPTVENGAWKQMEKQTAPVGSVPNFRVPSESYTDYEWENVYYSDSQCTQVVTDAMWKGYSEGADVIVYGKYKYVGGTYTVTFYNDKTANGQPTSESKVFPANKQPTLPTNPTGVVGTQFAHWEIVDTTASVSGTRYSPDTFRPKRDTTYIFKAIFDVAGVITNVQNQKNDYNVGDNIDKSKLVVTVQTDATGTTRTLATNEFTVNPTTIQNAGENNVTVTYTATGSTYNIKISGAAVNPQSITAQYTGSNLTVGTTIPTSNVKVTVHFSNGKSDTVSNFTLNPTTVQQVGSNTITVTYNSLTTTITVTGVAAETPSQPSDKTLSMLSGRYIGGTKYVGDSLSASDFQIVARYSDGTTETLGAGTYTFSPNSLRNAGSTVVGISYGGKSCSISVNALSRDSVTGGNPSSGGSSGSGSSGGSSGSGSSGGSSSSGSGSSGSSGSGNNSSNSNGSGNSYNGNNTGNNNTGNNNSGNNSTTNSNNNSSSGQSNSGTSSTESGDTTGNSTTSSIEVNPITNDGTVLALGNEGDPTTGAGVPAEKTSPSPRYIFGKTILDSTTMGANNVEFEQPDILAQILGAGDTASSVDIRLLNGSASNIITSSMLSALKEKDLTMHITMLNPDDTSTSVGNWTVIGSELDNEEFMFDANIAYQATDKNSERLVFMGVGTLDYPRGMSLTIRPVSSYYNSGEVVRLYATNAFLSDSIYLKTINWSDYDNSISVDLYSYTGYCMSNLPSAYPDGSDLTATPVVTDEPEGESTPEEIIIDFGENGDSEDESFDWGEDESSPFDWGDDGDTIKPKKGFKLTMPIIIGIIAVIAFIGIAGVIVIVIISKSAKKRSGGTITPDEELEVPIDSDVGEEELTEDFAELPGDDESEEVESFDDESFGGE